MPSLTKVYIDKLEPKLREYTVWDDKISGFGVRVMPSGRKAYIMKFRRPDGRQAKPNIGLHGHITCEQARIIAKEWHGELAKGNDPTQIKVTLRQSPTLSDLAERYYREHVLLHNKPASQYTFRLYIDKYIAPQLGTRKVLSLNKDDVMKLHFSLKDTPVMANRVIGVFSKMMNLAEEWGMRPQNSNPALGVKKFREETRERYLSDEEVTRLFETLEQCEKDGTESVYMVALIRLLLLTGARLSEIKNAKWEWLNEESNTLQLPDSKTGKKVIRLSAPALEILKKLPKEDGNPYIIVGGVKGKHLDNAQKAWRRIRKLSGLEDVRMHDLRHTYASICIGQGMALSVIAKLLGHSRVRTTERYAHLADDPIATAAAEIGDFISRRSSRG